MKLDPSITAGIGTADPLRDAKEASPALAASWLKNGERLTTVQRIGHGLMSVTFVGAAGCSMQGAIENLQDDGPLFMAFLFGAIGLFFLLFGLTGLRNVFRFKPSAQ